MTLHPEADTATLAAVGQITLSWNALEETLERLLWFYIGSPEKGHIVTSLIGNTSRRDALVHLSDALEALPTVKEHVACFAAAFDVLRLNRNTIVHSVDFNISHDGETFFLERLKKAVRTREYDTLNNPVGTLQNLVDQIEALTVYGETMLEIMAKRTGLIEQPFFSWDKPPPWPEKFQLPQRLN